MPRPKRLLPAAMLALLCALASPTARAQLVQEHPEPPAASWRSATLSEYRAHLQDLQKLTAACAGARTAETCDPAKVGPDDEVPWGAAGQKRVVRFSWLRVLLERAQHPDDAVKAKGATPPPLNPGEPDDKPEPVATTSQLLDDAQDRLADDIDQAAAAASPLPPHPQERAVLNQVLTGREFRNLKQAAQGPTPAERISNWIYRAFDWLSRQQTHAAWVGRTLVWGFLTLVGVGLIWGLLQMERRWRIRLVPDADRPAPSAASARDWQLWLNDARDAAARSQWREAIHFLYWASISRLESKKLWPADRARTPREYLALVAPDDPRKSGLGALTREFEWTWYGGRPAAESDYHRADELASALFDSGGQPR
ncbi:DUF4129 domain-containing protein [Occallatibacter riparius]|uniref:DUF4129 domain-containing protein n=1 Tax=Occallatibacter riparius TaxID=1002689 RepID=A0A9J7BTQ3_9BACT|nr:DUF4129 domain-containing protein [Occallatibacter riparius]UWZ84294.1 DUF4129 domain-containing protein [Occallatibacter riparius]